GGDGEVMGSSSRGRSGIAADYEALGSGRVDGHGSAAGDRTGDCVGAGDGLAAGGLENDPGEGVHASIGGRESIVAGQDGRAIGTGKVDRSHVAGGLVIVGIKGRDGDTEGGTCRARGRRHDLQVTCHYRIHRKFIGTDVVGLSLRPDYAVEIHRHLGQSNASVDGRGAGLQMEIVGSEIDEQWVDAEEVVVGRGGRPHVHVVGGPVVRIRDIVADNVVATVAGGAADENAAGAAVQAVAGDGVG